MKKFLSSFTVLLCLIFSPALFASVASKVNIDDLPALLSYVYPQEVSIYEINYDKDDFLKRVVRDLENKGFAMSQSIYNPNASIEDKTSIITLGRPDGGMIDANQIQDIFSVNGEIKSKVVLKGMTSEPSYVKTVVQSEITKDVVHEKSFAITNFITSKNSGDDYTINQHYIINAYGNTFSGGQKIVMQGNGVLINVFKGEGRKLYIITTAISDPNQNK